MATLEEREQFRAVRAAAMRDSYHQPYNQAIALIERAGLVARVTKMDGQGLMGVCDARTDRLNLEVDNGIVTKVYVG